MITITQKVRTAQQQEKILLTKGMDYLESVRKLRGCQSFQLTRDMEKENLFYFQSVWSTLDDVNRFFQCGLDVNLSTDWNLLDHTIELDCKSVNVAFCDDLTQTKLNEERLISKLSKLGSVNLKIRRKPDTKYASSHLSQTQISHYLKVIQSHMEEHEPFKRKDLSLTKFAKEVGLHSHHVSRVINERLNQNFSDFVNCYRVELAKQLLIKDLLQRYTISGIGDEAGFNSRSAFYNAFRKFTGKSPGEFIEANRLEIKVA